MGLADLGALLLSLAALAAGGARDPLPIYLEDNHAGAFEFLAHTLDPVRPHVLLLVDAHADDSAPPGLLELRALLRRAAGAEERAARLESWRRDGRVQSFDWILPLVPRPLERVYWVRPPWSSAGPAPEGAGSLHPTFTKLRLDAIPSGLPPDLPVVASVDLDSFAGLAPELQRARFEEVWRRVVSTPRLVALTFAISRPWLEDDAEASRLVVLALRASLSLAHAELRFRPWGIEGPDRSEQAKRLYRAGRKPARFDVETASAELRALLLANEGRLRVVGDGARWQELESRWRADGEAWHVRLGDVQPGVDGILRPPPGSEAPLWIEGGLPGRVRAVTWRAWKPKQWAYTILPDLPAGKTFVGAAPPLVEYVASVLARTSTLTLPAEVWQAALPGPDHSGVLRVSAQIETDEATVETARIELRRALGAGFHGALSEQFGLPYVFGAGFLERAALRGPDTGVGNDCANFLVAAWRRAGVRMAWSNPAQLRRYLSPLRRSARIADRIPIPEDGNDRGVIVHLGSHVAALWSDVEPLATLGAEDLLVHHLGGAPEVLTLGALLSKRPRRASFDVYLGPSRAVAEWVAIGGDVMPGSNTAAPAGLRELFARADLAVANLETSVGSARAAPAKRYAFTLAPSRLRELRDVGLSAVALANNHAGDFGHEGLRETREALDREGLGHFGSGTGATGAAAAWIGRAGEHEVAFVAVTLTDPDRLPASDGSLGVAALPAHAREIARSISEARRRARVVVVMPHWGREGTTEITDAQRHWARWLVAQGADAVVGSGPHVVQPVEMVSGVPVFYSLGNLWFEGSWPPLARAGAVAFLGLGREGRVRVAQAELRSVGTSTPSREATPPPRDAPPRTARP
jgi:poly-gamma-glutamate capsule biosynthesis protein CapA/YwtB (metallophosphatase superfamily)